MLLAASCAELYKREASVYAPLLAAVSFELQTRSSPLPPVLPRVYCDLSWMKVAQLCGLFCRHIHLARLAAGHTAPALPPCHLLQAQPSARLIAARTLHEVYGAKMLPWLIGGACCSTGLLPGWSGVRVASPVCWCLEAWRTWAGWLWQWCRLA